MTEPAFETSLAESATAMLAPVSVEEARSCTPEGEASFSVPSSEVEADPGFAFATTVESTERPELEHEPPSDKGEWNAAATDSEEIVLAAESTVEALVLDPVDASHEAPVDVAIELQLESPIDESSVEAFPATTVESFTENREDSSVESSIELSVEPSEETVVEASFYEAPVASSTETAIAPAAERMTEESVVIEVDACAEREGASILALPDDAPTGAESPRLLDAELASFRLTPHEVLHLPTPIPGLDNILEEPVVGAFEGQFDAVAAAAGETEHGMGPAASPGDSLLEASDEGIQIRAGLDVEQASSRAARHSDEAPERLAERDAHLQEFVQRSESQARVLETLEAVARRVRAGEIVPAAPADASPEAVLASVLASLLTARS